VKSSPATAVGAVHIAALFQQVLRHAHAHPDKLP
jgi:hypothetical protein